MRFFLLTFALSWSCYLAAHLLWGPDIGVLEALGYVLFYVGVVAPALTALFLTRRAAGRAGIATLVGQIARWQVPARWYVFALGYMAAVKLSASVLYRITAGSWPVFNLNLVLVAPFAIAVSTWVQAGEELGWRGYALPRLSTRMGVGLASILLGVIWALWHLPLFYMTQLSTAGQPFPVYVLQVTALSVAIAWLYWRTGSSLLLAMVMHAAINNTKDIVPSGTMSSGVLSFDATRLSWFTAALLWIGAAYFLFRLRGANLTHNEEARAPT